MIEERKGQLLKRDKDSYQNIINSIPTPTHFYYIEETLYGKNNIRLDDGQPITASANRNLKPFTHSGMVLNMLYVPFLTKGDLDLFQIPYDQKSFGTVADNGTGYEEDVNVFKIIGGKIEDKHIGSFKLYPKFNRSEYYSPLNESKLYLSPYYYITINDYINQPLQLNTMWLKPDARGDIDVMVSQPISVTGSYTIYINNYKGDKNKGANEGLFSAVGMDIPTSSTAYSQFMAYNKNVFQAEQNAIANNYSTANKTALLGALGNPSTTIAGGAGVEAYKGYKDFKGSLLGSMGAGAALGSVAGPLGTAIGAGVGLVANTVSSHISAKNNKNNAIEYSQAKINDLLSAPRNVSLSSGDILTSIDRNERKIVANRYEITDYYKEKLARYWTLYGYKQNKLMKVNRKSRKYFNYIKTIDANIVGENLDKSEIEMIKNIYNSGITFWHTENNAKMFDYSKDNKETYK